MFQKVKLVGNVRYSSGSSKRKPGDLENKITYLYIFLILAFKQMRVFKYIL